MKLTKNQKLWIEALRSGKYKQYRGTLQADDSFCCLGVACKVAEEHGVEVKYYDGYTLYGHSLLHQKPVQEWLGLFNDHGVPIDHSGVSLTSMNDHGASFEEIADIVERYPERYFVNEGQENETM